MTKDAMIVIWMIAALVHMTIATREIEKLKLRVTKLEARP